MAETAEFLELFSQAFGLFRKAIGAVKDAKDLLPDKGQREALDKTLDEAERASRLAEAQIAKALGYHLCQCTFPPQIMLSVGYGELQERFECPKCGNAWPPPPAPARSYGTRRSV